MKRGWRSKLGRRMLVGALVFGAVALAAEEPTAAATAGFNAYMSQVEARLTKQHQSADTFLAPVDAARLHNGELIIEKLTPAAGVDLPGAMLHDWRGTAFVPGAKGEDFERLMRDFGAYPRYYAPEVLLTRVLAQAGGDYRVTMRVRQKHILTVVMDITYDFTFRPRGSTLPVAQRGYSASRSTRIAEIDSAGTPQERALSASEEHGFLWRLNTYWSYEERDGGLYLQIESASLTRSIPTGLAWAIGPFVESVPRESLEFTLGATRDALRK